MDQVVKNVLLVQGHLERFARNIRKFCKRYVMKNNVANIISGDLVTQLRLLILHNKQHLQLIHQLFLQITLF